jgi:uncharacterized protein YlxW (UPF0749 family)
VINLWLTQDEIEELETALGNVVEQRGWQSKENSRLVKEQNNLVDEIEKYQRTLRALRNAGDSMAQCLITLVG